LKKIGNLRRSVMVMLHIIDKVKPDHEKWMAELIKEAKSGEYKRLCDCPSYRPLKAINNSINCLNDYMGFEQKSIEELFNEANAGVQVKLANYITSGTIENS